MDYLLDNLGWYEFEELVQTLLKVRLGMGVEAWGGRGDRGRDAFFRESLRYPTNDLSPGPFVFQCKFVECANAAGARPEPLVVEAVRKECGRLSNRILPGGACYPPPAHYVLFTNATLSPKTRATIDSLIGQALGNTVPHIQDGHDICQWLNVDRSIVRAFPQLMSIRDLNEFLLQTVHADVISRSETAIEMAKAESRVFVPTEAYFNAVAVLQKHFFVVLEGPPEMGKTTIGRIISLAQLSRGWEAIECRGPQDFLAMHRKGVGQVFVADDFFGRTEYDPSRVRLWQADLPHILRRLDFQHWLILTSRGHLLEMAKSNLDIAGESNGFPDVAEIVVDAGSLTDSDKARVLYRHAKAAQFDTPAKEAIKKHAKMIVSNPHFTPERIRSLLTEVVPALMSEGNNSDEQIRASINNAISNPSTRMRTSFRALPVCHRWFLYSLLCGDGWTRIARSDAAKGDLSLQDHYEALCPPEHQRLFDEVKKELSEAFIADLPLPFADAGITWIHPSYQDLAIEELSTHPVERRRFLCRCSEAGIALATSIGGGDKGSRDLPLLKTEDDWEALTPRCIQLARQGGYVLNILSSNLDAINNLVAQRPSLAVAAPRLHRLLLESVLPATAHAFANAEHSWPLNHLEILLRLRASAGTDIPLDLSPAWESHVEDLETRMPDDEVIWRVGGAPGRFLQFVRLIEQFEPQFLEREWVRNSLDKVIGFLANRGETESRTQYFDDHSADELEEVVEGYECLSKSYATLADSPWAAPEHQLLLKIASAHFRSEAYSHQEEVAPEPEWDGFELPSRSSIGVSVDEVFCDL